MSRDLHAGNECIYIQYKVESVRRMEGQGAPFKHLAIGSETGKVESRLLNPTCMTRDSLQAFELHTSW